MSTAVKILIVEDEAILALDLTMRLQKEGYLVVGSADNAEEAIAMFTSQQPDLVLMDININGDKDGIATAQEIKLIRDVPIIFLTAFSQHEYVNRAKVVNPAAYLVKPYNNDSLYTSIAIALHNFALLKQTTDNSVRNHSLTTTEDSSKVPLLFFDNFFFVKNNYKFNKIAISELLYIRSDNNYIELITTSQKIVVRISLQLFASTVSHKHLVRVHKSFIVNLQKIESFNDEEVFIGKQSIPIGRTYKTDFLNSFNFL